MSKSLLIMGESGSGKTTSMRNLPPDQTLYIDADGKGLSWRGWREQYNAELKNYWKLNSGKDILGMMVSVNKTPKYRYLVIDTINGAMLASEMNRAKEKGYDKWTDLASDAYEIVNAANNLRDDLTVIIVGHSETILTDDGYRQTRLKTNGRKLEKIVLESKFTTVLLCEQRNGKHLFITRGDNTTAKAPMGMFESDEIENDIMIVIKAMEEY